MFFLKVGGIFLVSRGVMFTKYSILLMSLDNLVLMKGEMDMCGRQNERKIRTLGLGVGE